MNKRTLCNIFAGLLLAALSGCDNIGEDVGTSNGGVKSEDKQQLSQSGQFFGYVNEIEIKKKRRSGNKLSSGYISKTGAIEIQDAGNLEADATFDFGDEKSFQWVSQYDVVQFDINFKKDVSTFAIESIVQYHDNSQIFSGRMVELYTPTDSNSCMKKSYKAGENCSIAFVYKGLEIPSPMLSKGKLLSELAEYKNRLSFNFSVNGVVDNPLNITLVNKFASNADKVATFVPYGIGDSNSDWLNIVHIKPNHQPNYNIINYDHAISNISFLNLGTNTVGAAPDNPRLFLDIAVGSSNPKATLPNIKYQGDSYDTSVRCDLSRGVVGINSKCDMFGEIDDETVNSYQGSLVLHYYRQGNEKDPIDTVSFLPLVLSKGEFEPKDIYLDNTKDTKENIFISPIPFYGVATSSFGVYSHPSNIKFHVERDLARYVPYFKLKDHIVYDLSTNNTSYNIDKVSHVDNLTDDITQSSDYYTLTLDEYTPSGVLVVDYDTNIPGSGSKSHVSQVLGVVSSRDVIQQSVEDVIAQLTGGSFCKGTLYDYDSDINDDGEMYYFSRNTCSGSQGKDIYHMDMFASYDTKIEFPSGNTSFPNRKQSIDGKYVFDDVEPTEFRRALYGKHSNAQFWDAPHLAQSYPYMRLLGGIYLSGLIFDLDSHNVTYKCLLHMQNTGDIDKNKSKWRSGQEVAAIFDCWDTKTYRQVFHNGL